MPGDYPLPGSPMMLARDIALTPAQVSASAVEEQLFTVPGVRPGDHVTVNKPTVQANLGIAGCRASGPDQVAIAFITPGAGAVTPTAGEVYSFRILRG